MTITKPIYYNILDLVSGYDSLCDYRMPNESKSTRAYKETYEHCLQSVPYLKVFSWQKAMKIGSIELYRAFITNAVRVTYCGRKCKVPIVRW